MQAFFSKYLSHLIGAGSQYFLTKIKNHPVHPKADVGPAAPGACQVRWEVPTPLRSPASGVLCAADVGEPDERGAEPRL